MWLLTLPSAYRAGPMRTLTHHSRAGLLTCAVGTQEHTAEQQAVEQHGPRWSVVQGAAAASVLDPSDRIIRRRPRSAPPDTPPKAALPREPTTPLRFKTQRVAPVDDPVKWYLRSIGTQRLLTPEEVTALARRIQQMLEWQALREEMDARMEREVTDEDVTRLTEIRIKRISKFDSFKADERLAALEGEIARVKHDLEHLTEFAIAYFQDLKKKYGKGRERRTELRRSTKWTPPRWRSTTPNSTSTKKKASWAPASSAARVNL